MRTIKIRLEIEIQGDFKSFGKTPDGQEVIAYKLDKTYVRKYNGITTLKTESKEGVTFKHLYNDLMRGEEGVELLAYRTTGKNKDRKVLYWPFKEGFRNCFLKKGYQETLDFGEEKPFTAIENGETIEIVATYGSADMLFDINDRPIPTYLPFDYCSGGISNAEYDLGKLVEILSAREDIEFLVPDKSHACEGQHIYLIPYYNSSSDRNRFVEFKWFPSSEDYALIWDTAIKRNYEYPSTRKHEICHELDLLGIKDARIDRPDD